MPARCDGLETTLQAGDEFEIDLLHPSGKFIALRETAPFSFPLGDRTSPKGKNRELLLSEFVSGYYEMNSAERLQCFKGILRFMAATHGYGLETAPSAPNICIFVLTEYDAC